MTGKSIRTLMTVVLLAMVMVLYSPVKIVPKPANVPTPTMQLAEEYGTTAS